VSDFYVADEPPEVIREAMSRKPDGSTVGKRKSKRLSRADLRRMHMTRREWNRLVKECANTPPWDGSYPVSITGSNSITIHQSLDFETEP
jgi:hypothetical protein